MRKSLAVIERLRIYDESPAVDHTLGVAHFVLF